MALRFRRIHCPPLASFDAEAPAGAVVGIIGEDGSGKGTLLRLASGIVTPRSGSVEAPPARRLLGPDDALDLSPTDALLLYHTLARRDWAVRQRAAVAFDRLRRAGCAVLLVSHEEELLRQVADEIWWLHEGQLAGCGDPAEILRAYRRHIAAKVRAWGEAETASLPARLRRGDGRAEIVSIETLGESGSPTTVWRSGEPAVIEVCVRLREAVAEPVIGILIRTRIGLNVYGTNTELEGLQPGPCAAGDCLRLSFAFRCELCPGEYTLTAASHDPDGVWHDWQEDARTFSVVDDRHTAGVANLRARVTLEG